MSSSSFHPFQGSGEHSEYADLRVGVAHEKVRTIRRPGERGSDGEGAVLRRGDLGADLVDDRLRLQVKDLDARRSRRAEPVTVRGEDKGVDLVSGLEGVEVLALVEVPKHRDAVLAARSAERTVGGDGDGRDVAGVAEVVRAELALGELPDLDDLVPSSRDDDGVHGVGREADARDPLGVAVL